MHSRLEKWVGAGLLVLLVNAGYLAAFASATVFYMANVLLHVVLGVVLAGALLLLVRRSREVAHGAATALSAFLICFLAGAYLTWKGSLIELRWVLWVHVIAGGLCVAAAVPWIWKRSTPVFRRAFAGACVVLVGLPLVMIGYRKAFPDPLDRITNPSKVPTEMAEEGGGPKSPFFPSSAKTNVGGIIPSNFFMDSETCGECHKQIYERVEELDAPLRIVQQPVLSEVDRVHAGRAGSAAEQVVRRLSRPRGLLQWPLRPPDQRIRSIRRKRTPVWHARRAMPSRMWIAPWAMAVSPSSTRRCIRLMTSKNRFVKTVGRLHDLSESGAAPAHVHEAVHDAAGLGVLLDLPQGAPGRAREQLSLVPRFQRLRQLAGERLRRRRAIVLLPAERPDLRRLPHAAGTIERSGESRAARCTRTVSRRRTLPCRWPTTTRFKWKQRRSF